jgi:hypothetical protein
VLLPGEHAVGHAFVKVGRADGSLYTREPHPLAHAVAHTGEGGADALALHFLMKSSSASQALVSMKFTESASSSTCFAGGRLQPPRFIMIPLEPGAFEVRPALHPRTEAQ